MRVKAGAALVSLAQEALHSSVLEGKDRAVLEAAFHGLPKRPGQGDKAAEDGVTVSVGVLRVLRSFVLHRRRAGDSDVSDEEGSGSAGHVPLSVAGDGRDAAADAREATSGPRGDSQAPLKSRWLHECVTGVTFDRLGGRSRRVERRAPFGGSASSGASSALDAATQAAEAAKLKADREAHRARMAMLKARAEHRQYKSLISSISHREEAAAKKDSFATFSQQSGVGVNVFVALLSGVGVGYFLGHAWDPVGPTAWVCGLLFGIGVLLVESALVVIRLTAPERKAAMDKAMRSSPAARSASKSLLPASDVERRNREVESTVARSGESGDDGGAAATEPEASDADGGDGSASEDDSRGGNDSGSDSASDGSDDDGDDGDDGDYGSEAPGSAAAMPRASLSLDNLPDEAWGDVPTASM